MVLKCFKWCLTWKRYQHHQLGINCSSSYFTFCSRSKARKKENHLFLITLHTFYIFWVKLLQTHFKQAEISSNTPLCIKASWWLQCCGDHLCSIVSIDESCIFFFPPMLLDSSMIDSPTCCQQQLTFQLRKVGAFHSAPAIRACCTRNKLRQSIISQNKSEQACESDGCKQVSLSWSVAC